MREYGQIQCSFWGNPDIADLTDQGKLLAGYLLTGPHSNGLGCYRLPNGYVTEDLGWDSETVSKGFTELFEIGFADRCERTKFVLIFSFLKWNPVSNPNVAKSREKEFAEIPSGFSLKQQLAAELLEHGKHWSEPFRNRLERVVGISSETLSKQDPTRPDPNPYLGQEEGLGKPGHLTAVGGGRHD